MTFINCKIFKKEVKKIQITRVQSDFFLQRNINYYVLTKADDLKVFGT